jgi:hypothetical protein
MFNPRAATVAVCHAFAIGLFQFSVPLRAIRSIFSICNALCKGGF